MSRTLILEDFAPAPLPPRAKEAAEGLTETQRLSAFEQGYKDGWDDAVAASEENQSHVTSDLAARLQDLSFGFHEARAHVLAGVETLVKSVVENLAPRLAAEMLPTLVHEHLSEIIKNQAEVPVRLRVAPESRAAIEAILPQEPGFPLTVEDSPDFAKGQVAFAMGPLETELNLEACFEQIELEVAGFFAENEKVIAHG